MKPLLRILTLAALPTLAGGCFGGCDDDGGSRKSPIEQDLPGQAVIGTLTTSGTDDARWEYTYDALGRMVYVHARLGDKELSEETKYGYPVDGAEGRGVAVVWRKLASGDKLHYGLASDGSAVRAELDRGGVRRAVAAGVRRNARGDQTEVTLGNGTRLTRRYDDAGDLRLRRVALQRGDEALFDQEYVFDEVGNLTRVTDAVRPSRTAAYEYDDLDRLTSATIGGAASAYDYDAAGNLTAKGSWDASRGRPVALTQAYDHPDKPHAVTRTTTEDGEAITYTYDATGNLVQRSDGLALEWNEENMPVVTRLTRGAVTTTITRSFVGEQPYRKVEDGVTTLYPFEGTRVEGAALRIDLDSYAETAPDGSLRYLLPDTVGSTTLVTDEAGNVVFDGSYMPYGELRTGAGAAALYTPKTEFADRERDGVGLYDFGARLYDPRSGRFISPDGVLAGSAPLNRYAYASNNPTTRIDPDGHADQDPKKDGTAPAPRPVGAEDPLAKPVPVTPPNGVEPAYVTGSVTLGLATLAVTYDFYRGDWYLGYGFSVGLDASLRVGFVAAYLGSAKEPKDIIGGDSVSVSAGAGLSGAVSAGSSGVAVEAGVGVGAKFPKGFGALAGQSMSPSRQGGISRTENLTNKPAPVVYVRPGRFERGISCTAGNMAQPQKNLLPKPTPRPMTPKAIGGVETKVLLDWLRTQGTKK